MEAEAAGLAARDSQTADLGAEMLARHLEGDPRAFGELVDRYGGGIYAYLHRSGLARPAADDLFQETFLRVHRSAGRFDPARPFQTWLFTIATNLVRSHFRKRRVRRIMTGWWRRPAADPQAEPVALDPPDPAADPELRASDREQVRLIERALSDLPDGPRRALLLTKVQGMSLAQAADALGVAVPTVKTWVRRGRLALADALAGADGRDEPAGTVESEGQGEVR